MSLMGKRRNQQQGILKLHGYPKMDTLPTIALRLNVSYIHHIDVCDTTFDAWDNLENVFTFA